jgi:ubiquinone/menaquinone biosynthesis C-methylase UbiE
MLSIAHNATKDFNNIELVEADGQILPFNNNSFNIVLNKLASYSIEEVYRVLKRNGYFFEYGLGPEADREIKEFFQERIEKENFFSSQNMKEWKQEVIKEVVDAGLVVSGIEVFKEYSIYENDVELMDLIEMVPLVRDFDRQKDRKRIRELAEKYGDEEGVKITWHYYVLMARKF